MSPERAECRKRKPKRTIEAASAANPPPQPQPPAKRQKTPRRSRSRTPPEFWDNLSRVPLCRRALRELDRRTVRPTAPKPPARSILKKDLVKLKRFARRGGPDLRNIRGYPEPDIEPINKMPPKHSGSSGRSRKGTQTEPSTALDETTKPTKYSSKDPAFRQALIDVGIYPPGRSYIEPENIEGLVERLSQPRPSLSPSVFPRTAFTNLRWRNDEAMSEANVIKNLFPIIQGGNTLLSGENFPFNHLEQLASNISKPQPDYYNGSDPKEVHPKVREDLRKYIIPCNDTSRPLLPNFFAEVKGPDGSAAQMMLQITQDLAAGARGIHKMQSYGQEQPVYDVNAYTIGSTYHSGTGTLQLYAMHPTPPEGPGGQPEYHTTQINGYQLTGNPDSCRQGIAAFRNAQDWAKEQRDRFITYANEVAAGQLQQVEEDKDEEEEEEEEEESGEEESGEEESGEEESGEEESGEEESGEEESEEEESEEEESEEEESVVDWLDWLLESIVDWLSESIVDWLSESVVDWLSDSGDDSEEESVGEDDEDEEDEEEVEEEEEDEDEDSATLAAQYMHSLLYVSEPSVYPD